MNDDLLLKIKRLRRTLLVSGLLNIFFIFFIILWSKETSPPLPELQLKTRKTALKPYIAEKSAEEILLSFSKKPFHELASALKDTTLVENGFTVRDFALGSLISERYFNTDKAFEREPKLKQKRKISYTDSQGIRKEVTLFSDARSEHFDAAIAFLAEEKWPMTSFGIYAKLLETKTPDPSLVYMFTLTKEYKNLEMLMRKARVGASESELVALSLEGPFDNLKMLNEQHLLDDEIKEIKREFLLSYAASGSETASQLLLKSDFEFTVKKTDDKTALKILSSLIKEIPESRKFALALLLSPRGESIWELAAKKLYELSGEKEPVPLTRRIALARFAPVMLTKNESQERPVAPPAPIEKKIAALQKPIEKAPPPPKPKGKRAYIVQEGDTLFKISKRFNVDADEIRKLNDLPSSYLKPGALIRLP